jgi:mono/diheme cytochrome c family protein
MVKGTSKFIAMAAILAEILVTGAPSSGVADPSSSHEGAPHADPKWAKLSVELPTSTRQFPAGDGASIANSQCLICHSAGMVLTQPQRTQTQWQDTINKMRTAYGAPIPAEQVDSLAAYLTRVVSGESAVQAASADPQPNSARVKHDSADGAAIFAAQCASCHQAAGTGVPGAFPPLAGSNWVNGRDVTLTQILLHGIQGTLTVNGTAYNGAMPSFGHLSDADIAAVLTYVRSQWGNKAGAVGTALVSTQRAATSTRSEPWHGDSDLTKLN